MATIQSTIELFDNFAYTSCALPDNFLDNGKIAILYGASAGCRCNTTLVSPSAISSSS